MAAQPPSAVFARRVKEVRERRGMKQEDVATRLGEAGLAMDRATIARIEAQRRKVSLDEAFAFAYALDVAPVYLFVPLEDDALVLVTPHWIVPGGRIREWVRGRYPLPGQDSRVYRTEVPDEEWDAIEHAQQRGQGASREEIREFFERTGRSVYAPGPTGEAGDDSEERGG